VRLNRSPRRVRAANLLGFATFGLLPAALSVLVCRPLEADEAVVHGHGLARRKAAEAPPGRDPAGPAPIAATLVQTHTGERVILDAVGPADARFDALLADRITDSSRAMDPRLLGLLRGLVASFQIDPASGREAPRIELVSGFRSPKLNEMLRKKGHHVASHSQHSLGHAVDFRVVLPEKAHIEKLTQRGVDPRELEQRIRALGWAGGVGIYLSKDDWFVHADVGPNRRWLGQ
jgi:uncharacterized protein YcbK (DUF882 family)